MALRDETDDELNKSAKKGIVQDDGDIDMTFVFIGSSMLRDDDIHAKSFMLALMVNLILCALLRQNHL